MKNIKIPKILLIIPAYNEEKSILFTYKTIVEYNEKNSTNFDVLVVNDGSSDSTERILRDNNIPHVQLKENLGIGGAVQTGYKYALSHKYDVAIQYDGDGQHDVACVADVVEPIKNGDADMVIGSRFIDDESSEFKSTGVRRAGINIISFFIKLFTGKKIYDTTSGFRASGVEAIKSFAYDYPHEYPEPVSTTKLLKMDLRVSEVPVKMHEREAGVSSISS